MDNVIVINCSKDAAEFFSTTRQGVITSPLTAAPAKDYRDDAALLAEVSAEPLFIQQFLVHLVTIDGKKQLIVMELHTRFTVVITGIRKGDYQGFLDALQQQLSVVLQSTFDRYLPELDIQLQQRMTPYKVADTRWHQRSDRSAQGQINQVALLLKDGFFNDYQQAIDGQLLFHQKLNAGAMLPSRATFADGQPATATQALFERYGRQFAALTDTQLQLWQQREYEQMVEKANQNYQQTQLQLALVGSYYNFEKFSRAGFSSADVLNFQNLFINADDSYAIVNLAELDGLLACIVAGPEMIHPSQWLPLVISNADDHSEAEIGEAVNYCIKLLNYNAQMLMENQQAFCGLWLKDQQKVDFVAFCYGFMLAMTLAPEPWLSLPDELKIRLQPMLMVAMREPELLKTFADLPNRLKELLCRHIEDTVCLIQLYWLKQRAIEFGKKPAQLTSNREPVAIDPRIFASIALPFEEILDYACDFTKFKILQPAPPPQQPVRRDQQKTGRNDPCPCGSGRKYKKCCGSH
jgi:yecA family protein